MAKNLLGWAADQPDWVRDSLRPFAISADNYVEQADADCILDNVPAALLDETADPASAPDVGALTATADLASPE
jgi:hypothetical protein